MQQASSVERIRLRLKWSGLGLHRNGKTPMRFHTLSDLHIEHATFDMPEVESDVLILAGDILTPGHRAISWAARPSTHRGRPVVQVAGNHEFYGVTLQAERALMRQSAEKSGVHYLNRNAVVLSGVRFLGCTLWTDYRVPIIDTEGLLSDQKRAMAACARGLYDHQAISWRESGRTTLVTPLNLLHEHQLDRQWLSDELAVPFAGPTVVVTHHAPHPMSIAPQYAADWVTGGFVNMLPDSFFEVPKLWVHGHTHTRFDYAIGSCRVVCNPRGYRYRDGSFEGDGLDPRLVVEI